MRGGFGAIWTQLAFLGKMIQSSEFAPQPPQFGEIPETSNEHLSKDRHAFASCETAARSRFRSQEARVARHDEYPAQQGEALGHESR
jgi:hypothetical protein